jgi:hypothetical protein
MHSCRAGGGGDTTYKGIHSGKIRKRTSGPVPAVLYSLYRYMHELSILLSLASSGIYLLPLIRPQAFATAFSTAPDYIPGPLCWG